jgi:uncharacterized phiE125 gp8 family phage protein
MTLHLVTPPAGLPLSVLELREHLRLEGIDGQDVMVAAYLGAATAAIDGADGWLGRALLTQTWELRLDCFPWHGAIVVPLPPLQSVTSVEYTDTDGNDQVLAPSQYQVAGIGGARPARIYPAFGERWPSTRDQAEAVRVCFTAGYGDAPGHVPEPIRQAIQLMVAQSFEDREGTVGMSSAVESLLFPFRVW